MKPSSNGSSGVKDAGTQEMPSIEMVRQWIKRDVNAAAYFLNMIRNDDSVIEKIADALYERAQQTRKDDEMLNAD